MGLLADAFTLFIKAISYQYVFKRAKKKGILLYLKALQTIRKSLGFALLIVFVFQLMVFGLIGAVVSGVWLLPIDDNTMKIWILFIVFSAFFFIPGSVLLFLFSEKVWFRFSGAEHMVQSQAADL